MLIINADDYGKNEFTTHRILLCHRRFRVSSASAMVFMRDSEKSAELALEAGLDVGLHLNLTDPLSGSRHRPLLDNFHRAVSEFLAKTGQVPLYNPMLRRQFEYVYHAQYEEFQRLYRMKPSHVDGHHHMHLCANMIFDRVIPPRQRVRRSFHFFRGEKGFVKRFYRRLLNGWVSRRFSSTDYFFDLQPMVEERLSRIMNKGRISNVELMVHPEREIELDFLLSDRFADFLKDVKTGRWKEVALEEQKAPRATGDHRIGKEGSHEKTAIPLYK